VIQVQNPAGKQTLEHAEGPSSGGASALARLLPTPARPIVTRPARS
jgi:hypothetical protein